MADRHGDDTTAGRRRNGWRRLAWLFAVATVAFLTIWVFLSLGAGPGGAGPGGAGPGGAGSAAGPTASALPRQSDPPILPLLSVLGSAVSALGTVSTVILAWRKDRRDTSEFRKRLEMIEASRSNSAQVIATGRDEAAVRRRSRATIGPISELVFFS